MKRLFDVAASAFGLLVLSPLLAAVAVLIRRESPGPALFRQARVGRRGKVFHIHKFRTMVEGGKDVAGLSITTVGDPRVTPLGSVLRRYKVDELPQLLDVFVGDMSIVGPRPEVPQYVAEWPPDLRRAVLSVRPGITDPAAIEFIDEAGELSRFLDPERAYIDIVVPKKLALYEAYVRDRSFLGDARIVVDTVGALVRRALKK
jgi:lipopolysaccharide/colanic/teichoic acid biosynthesis glycosyltransferase